MLVGKKPDSRGNVMNEMHEANRKLWELRAADWAKRTDQRGLWQRCTREPSLVLSADELSVLGVVEDKQVCVLGSGDHEVVFALAGMGARVTSVDISEGQLQVGRERAETLGLEISFLRSDVTELQAIEDDRFDIVYTGGHVAVWVSDLLKFYREAVRILKPAGLFIVNEYHPFRHLWDETLELNIEHAYFERGPHKYQSEYEVEQYEYHWTVADFLQAVMQAGCEVQLVAEHGQGWDEWRETDLRQLPEYILIAGRKRAA
jgi:ubiquinone/menaquinone biosynthesis C-methylase UbiE